jgi:hypothetical protein
MPFRCLTIASNHPGRVSVGCSPARRLWQRLRPCWFRVRVAESLCAKSGTGSVSGNGGSRIVDRCSEHRLQQHLTHFRVSIEFPQILEGYKCCFRRVLENTRPDLSSQPVGEVSSGRKTLKAMPRARMRARIRRSSARVNFRACRWLTPFARLRRRPPSDRGVVMLCGSR